MTGDFDEAVKESSKVLAIRGRVLPSTLNKISLVAEHENGEHTFGESKISAESKSPIKKVFLSPSDSAASLDVLEAIKNAEAIIFGPGSLYTSIIANLLVGGVTDAIKESKGIKIYICNVMTQPGETDNYTASDHPKAIIKHMGGNFVEYCIVNTAKAPHCLIEKYKQESDFPLLADSENIRKLRTEVMESEIISAKDLVRHDPERLAQIVFDMLAKRP